MEFRAVNLRFACPVCDLPIKVQLPASQATCGQCDHLVPLAPLGEKESITQCLVCENPEIYRKKDFPHTLGLTILTVACLGSAIPYYLYHQWLTWAILIGTAVFDGLLYLWVGDVVVCYRCHAHFRGTANTEGVRPFDLGIGERYRQERLRMEQVRGKK
jgi:hypothetical protein